MCSTIVSELLRNLHEYDQKRRLEIIKEQGISKLAEAKEPAVFWNFKGECEERARIVLFLIDKNVLRDREDYYYAASVIINVGILEDFILAYKLIKKYRELGGNKQWGFNDRYFEIQPWNMTRDEVMKLVEKEIGMDPKQLDKYDGVDYPDPRSSIVS